jgi:hypothetical protein
VGEAEFGLVSGVTRTRQAWIGKEEVVEVWYDPKLLSFDKLLEHARTQDCARRVWTRTPAQAKLAKAALGELAEAAPASIRLDAEQKYYLLQTPLAQLALSEAQACRVNAQLEGEAFLRYLSPRQVKIAQHLIVSASKQQN